MIPEYLNQNVENIRNYNQNYDGWYNDYLNYRNIFPDINDIYERFDIEDNLLNRDNITLLFQQAESNEEYFRAFIATMIWGKRGLVGDGGVNPHFNSFNQNQNQISNFLRASKYQLAINDIPGAYNNLNNIHGLGISYITKVLYYQSKALEMPLMCLIFDKHQFRNYIALLSTLPNNGITKAQRLFRNLNTFPIYNSYKPFYLEFLVDMHFWSNELDLRSDKIEEFIFGADNNNIDNPRVQLRNIYNQII